MTVADSQCDEGVDGAIPEHCQCNDIWDRWRASEGLSPLAAPLTDAIGKLAEVADRQLALLQQATTIHSP
jgi:hypothetical protein